MVYEMRVIWLEDERLMWIYKGYVDGIKGENMGK